MRIYGCRGIGRGTRGLRGVRKDEEGEDEDLCGDSLRAEHQELERCAVGRS